MCCGAALGLLAHLGLAQVFAFSWYAHHGLVVMLLVLLSGTIFLQTPVWWSIRQDRNQPLPQPQPQSQPQPQPQQRTMTMPWVPEQGTRALHSDEAAELASLLHDTVGQGLTAIAMQARNSEQHDRRLQTIDEVAAHTMTELRNIIGQLHGGVRRPSPATEYLVDVVNRFRSGGLMIEFLTHGTDEQLSAPLRAVIVRIAREALTNSMKYAPDATVSVEFDVRARISLQVRSHYTFYPRLHEVDRTADRAWTVWSGGHGSRMMQRLVARHGGALRIGSSRRGFTILATFPLEGMAREAATARVLRGRAISDHFAD